MEQLEKLIKCVNEICDLAATGALLEWDQHTYMPEGAADGRSNHIATLARLRHARLTSNELGELLNDLDPFAKQMIPDSDEACMIKVTRREYDKACRVPVEWVAEFARTTSMASTVWEKAKADSDFRLFQPHLEQVVAQRRQYAEFFAPYDHVYDPQLDDFEPGLKTAEVRAIFDALRPQQVALIWAISERPRVDDAFLFQHYPEREQWDFGVEVITRLGYDFNHGRQDRSVHPFTTSFGLRDVRITTRFDQNNLSPALFGSMHEAGHALYEQGINKRLDRSLLANGASMAVHESQSRMFENLIGRSMPFWEYFYPQLVEMFPSQLGNVDLKTFYRGINRVRSSMIRVEADEATYNLHIMLRLELEIALLEGSLAVADLPEAWNSRMEAYFGLTPPDDRRGVLQDVHWSSGLMGYFPTYALGNLISAQLWECLHQDIPGLEQQICKGVFKDILEWLRINVHCHGAKFEPQILIQKVTGSKINPQPYMNYLKKKYEQIYQL
jgi:carboxypeptidase Taq